MVVGRFLSTNISFLGTIESDENMSKAIIQQKPICLAYPNSKAARSYKKLADNLLEMRESDDSQKGLVVMFLRKFKRKKGGV